MQFIDNFFGNRYPYPDLNPQLPRNPFAELPEGAPVDQIPTPVPEEPNPQITNPQDYFEAFKPEHAMQDMLTQLIQNYPQRNTPGVGRNILGLLAGLGAGAHPTAVAGGQPVGFEMGRPAEIMQAGDLARYRPFYNELADWDAKVKPVEAAANQERYMNSMLAGVANNRARVANATTNAQTRRDEMLSKGEKRQADITRDKENSRIKQLTYELQYWKATHPNHEIKMLEDGTLIGVDPQTNKASPIVMNNGETAKALSEAERQQMITNRELRIVKERGQVESGLINQRADAGIKRDAARGRIKGETPSQYNQRIQANTAKALIEHPEWKQYYDPTDKRFKTPLDMEPEEAERMRDAIFGAPGTDIPIQKDNTGSVTTPNQPKPDANKPNPNYQVKTDPNGMYMLNGQKHKNFPNGNVGMWDGKGWVMVGRWK